MLETIIEYRNYAHAKALIDSGHTAQTPLLQLVQTIEIELAQEEIAARGQSDRA